VKATLRNFKFLKVAFTNFRAGMIGKFLAERTSLPGR